GRALISLGHGQAARCSNSLPVLKNISDVHIELRLVLEDSDGAASADCHRAADVGRPRIDSLSRAVCRAGFAIDEHAPESSTWFFGRPMSGSEDQPTIGRPAQSNLSAILE